MKIPTKELEKLGTTLVRTLGEDLVRYGVIDPKGKSDAELHNEVLTYIAEIVKNKGNNIYA